MLAAARASSVQQLERAEVVLVSSERRVSARPGRRVAGGTARVPAGLVGAAAVAIV
jgi:hypothetical protein